MFKSKNSNSKLSNYDFYNLGINDIYVSNVHNYQNLFKRESSNCYYESEKKDYLFCNFYDNFNIDDNICVDK